MIGSCLPTLLIQLAKYLQNLHNSSNVNCASWQCDISTCRCSNGLGKVDGNVNQTIKQIDTLYLFCLKSDVCSLACENFCAPFITLIEGQPHLLFHFLQSFVSGIIESVDGVRCYHLIHPDFIQGIVTHPRPNINIFIHILAEICRENILCGKCTFMFDKRNARITTA